MVIRLAIFSVVGMTVPENFWVLNLPDIYQAGLLGYKPARNWANFESFFLVRINKSNYEKFRF